MTKRERIRSKFGGRCAYCGRELGKTFHADHVEPLCRNWDNGALAVYGRKKGKDSEDNLFPACPRCNRRKAMMPLEDFRLTIYAEVQMLRKYSDKFRLAEDFGIIKETGQDVVFWFEKYKEKNDAWTKISPSCARNATTGTTRNTGRPD